MIVNLLLFGVLLGTAEFLARVVAPRRLDAVFNDSQVFIRQRPFVVPHPGRGFALRAGYRHSDYQVNAAGFRGDELPPDTRDHALVLALGESSTFGWGVAGDVTFPAHLQRLLQDEDKSAPTLVLNAGVPSYSSAQVSEYLDELLQSYAPRVVLLQVSWNDALFACMPNWMPDYLRQQQPAPWRQWLLRHSGLYRAFVIREPAPSDTPERLDVSKQVAFYEETLESMVRACRRARVRVVLVPSAFDPERIPRTGMKIGRRTIPAAEFERILEAFRAAQARVAEREKVTLAHHRLERADAQTRRYFLDPVHLNGEGNRMVAEDLMSALGDLASVAAVDP